MSTEFEEFTTALERSTRRDSAAGSQPEFSRVTVLGGGTEGRLLAALSLSQNRSVTLFSAYGTELNALRAAGGITLRGDGPIGTFQTDQSSSPSIQTTAELDSAVASADLIFLTGPVHKHRTYAMVLADHLKDGQTLVIAPGRTFAAFEICSLLKVGGCQADITVLEVQNLPYWVEADGNTLHLSECDGASGGALPADQTSHLDALRELLPNVKSASTVLQSSFSDGSGAVECVALMLGSSLAAGTGKSLPAGAQPLPERETFRTLLDSERSRSVVSLILQERREVAKRYGIRNLPDDEIWINAHCGTEMGSGSRPIPSAQDSLALLRDAVTGSLIPLQSAGRLADVATPATDSLITLAGALLGRNIAVAGRRLEAMGVTADDRDEARRNMESLARGM